MGNVNDPTSIPRVPLQTPMFEDPTGNENFTDKWELTRTWIIFFERIFKSKLPGPYHRTLLLKDTTPGNSIADHTTIYVKGKGQRLTGVLRKAITADLTVRAEVLDIKNTGAGFQELIRLTIPQATSVNVPLDQKTFASKTLQAFHNGSVIRWDVLASDSSQDASGVASFSLIWDGLP